MSHRFDAIREFEQIGPEHVRLKIQTRGYNDTDQRYAVEWLAKKDKAVEAERQRISNEQVEIARSAAEASARSAAAAEKANLLTRGANRRATVAIWVSGLSVLATLAAAMFAGYVSIATS